MTEREYIEQQAKTLGVEIAGKLTRSSDNEKNNLEVCFVDEATDSSGPRWKSVLILRS